MMSPVWVLLSLNEASKEILILSIKPNVDREEALKTARERAGDNIYNAFNIMKNTEELGGQMADWFVQSGMTREDAILSVREVAKGMATILERTKP